MVDGVEEQSRFAGWRREVWLFMKAQLSAQIATVIDFLITILWYILFVCHIYRFCGWRYCQLCNQL